MKEYMKDCECKPKCKKNNPLNSLREVEWFLNTITKCREIKSIVDLFKKH